MNTKLNKNQRRTRVVVGQYQEIENLRSANAALLEALETLLDAYVKGGHDSQAGDNARTAIAKAKAEQS